LPDRFYKRLLRFLAGLAVLGVFVAVLSALAPLTPSYIVTERHPARTFDTNSYFYSEIDGFCERYETGVVVEWRQWPWVKENASQTEASRE
jgi:hypothetical protein